METPQIPALYSCPNERLQAEKEMLEMLHSYPTEISHLKEDNYTDQEIFKNVVGEEFNCNHSMGNAKAIYFIPADATIIHSSYNGSEVIEREKEVATEDIEHEDVTKDNYYQTLKNLEKESEEVGKLLGFNEAEEFDVMEVPTELEKDLKRLDRLEEADRNGWNCMGCGIALETDYERQEGYCNDCN